jgi:hypothetical protein
LRKFYFQTLSSGGGITIERRHLEALLAGEQLDAEVLGVTQDAVDLANAVPANGREKVECVSGPSLESDRNAFAHGIAVRHQSIEVVGDTLFL